VLVASDGLYDNLHRREIVEVIRKGKLLASAEELARSGIGRMTVPTEGEPSKPDDLTFILYRRSGA
jgi:serine/threonine protein phosphatase PrpC